MGLNKKQCDCNFENYNAFIEHLLFRLRENGIENYYLYLDKYNRKIKIQTEENDWDLRINFNYQNGNYFKLDDQIKDWIKKGNKRSNNEI